MTKLEENKKIELITSTTGSVVLGTAGFLAGDMIFGATIGLD